MINILDQRILHPHADQFSYTLSKIALHEATKILAARFAPHVRVVAVAPGLTLPTPEYDQAMMDRLARQMPLNRLTLPEEIAAAVLYLASASSTTGQVLFVDSGAHMKPYPRDFLYLDRQDHS